MKAHPSFSFYPVNSLDPECKEYMLRVDFTCESGHVFAAYMPVEGNDNGCVELKDMEQMFGGIGKVATALHIMFERAKEKANDFSGLDAPLPSDEIAAKADA